MEGRSYYLDRILDSLSVLYCRLNDAGRLNLQDRKVRAENIMRGLLNRIHGWSLKNANMLASNFPGVDLVDTTAGVAVQVTSTNSLDKVKNTWNKFDTDEMRSTYKKLYILVMKDEVPTKSMKDFVRDPWFDGSTDIWNYTTLSKQIEDIESVAMLKEISRYLQEQMGDPGWNQYRLPKVPEASEFFVAGSRDDDLRKMQELFDAKKTVYLCGVGGIGKTELAIQFAKTYAPSEGAYFMRCIRSDSGESLRESILQLQIEDYSFKGQDDEKREAEYKDRLQILAKFKGALVILDNWDGPNMKRMLEEKAFADLTALGLRLVITTRFCMRGGLEIERLSDGHLLGLIRSIYDTNRETVNDDLLLDLIDAVDGHTLMVNLMAQTLDAMWDDDAVEQMLEAIRSSDLDRYDFPEVIEDKDRKLKQDRLYVHLRTLFNFSGIKKNATECDIMRCATLLPAGGMRDTLFRSCLEPGQRQALLDLVGRGWIQHKSKLLMLHPVIREVCRGELKPDDRNCRPFLIKLRQQYDPAQYDARRFSEMAECFSVAATRLVDYWGDWSYFASELWSELGQPRKGLQFALRTVKKRQQRVKRARRESKPQLERQLASAYNMVCNAYCHLSEYEHARSYGERALQLRKARLEKGHYQIAASYNNLGMVYIHLEQYDKAMELLKEALRLRESHENPNQMDIANSYNNIGTAYYVQEDFEQALHYRQKALELRRVIHANELDHPDIAASINNVGRTYHEMGRYEDALQLLLQALQMRRNKLRINDSDLANSYYNVGHTYAAMVNYPEAIKHLEMALKTWERCGAQDNMYFVSTQQELEELRQKAAVRPV